MDRNQLIEKLMTTFLVELEEHVRTLNDDLLALEKDGSESERAERLKTLFRAAHSLKGAARSVGLTPIEDACHAVEEILTEARAGRAALDRPRFALLFETADAIEEAGMRLRERHDLADSPLVALLPRLERVARALGIPEPALAEPAPPPAPPPVPPAAAAEEPPAPPLPKPPPVPIPAREVGERPVIASAFVRVPAEKLDALLTRSGELLVARRAVEEQAGDIATLRESLGRWRDEWRGVARPLAALRREGGAKLSGHDRAADPTVRRLVQVVTRTGDHLKQLEQDIDKLARTMARDRRQLVRAASLLDEEVRRVRMLPFAEACQGLERIARDVARTVGKQAELAIEGGDVELDRSVLEGLKDPLTHLVRNAVDHGIEAPEARARAGKPPAGRIGVTAALRGAQVEIVVADDGAGIDLDALRGVARQRGLAESADERALVDLIFQPGVSTSSIITNISGRGVGLDVVKSRVEALHGTIDLTFEPGRWTRFTLSVPLTLTTLRCLLVESGGRTFAIASQHVQRLVRLDPADFRSIEGRPMLLAAGDAPMPVATLSETLGIAPAAAPTARAELKRPGLIVAVGDRRAAFVVDRLVAEQEIVVKRLGARLRRMRLLSGATLLPSGQIALVLNTGSLLRAALSRPGAWTARALAAGSATPAPAPKRLLVVDDSVTTRTLEKSILEAAGYEVATAVDGAAGWRLLQEQGADLVISDLEMPLMDGFALTETIKASPRFARLPVILFTSRGSESDRARGIEVGADAYIVKGAFDQKDLLETIAQLL